MVFLVLMAGKTYVACSNLPSMGYMTGGASRTHVVTLFVQLAGTAMTRPAVDHRLDFSLPKMACFAG